MVQKDERVDAYIKASAAFAQPILQHLRMLVHVACPTVQETIKWGFPNFMYHGILCSMAAFKGHSVFTFWKGALLSDPAGIVDTSRSASMGHFGRITHKNDLPSDELIIAYIQEAMKLNEQGVAVPKRAKKRLIESIDE